MKAFNLKQFFTITVILLAIFSVTGDIFAQQQLIQGQRIPRLTTAQRDQIDVENNVKAQGQIIYNIDNHCLEYWNSIKWVDLCLGSANITLIGDPCTYDPDALVPANGVQEHCTYTPTDYPECVVPSGQAYMVYLTAGSAYATLKVDELTSAFSITFMPNNSSYSRIAVVRVLDNCSGEFKDFVFRQEGADCPINATPFTVQTNTTNICGNNGAVIANIVNPQQNIDYIWEYGGVVINTGNYMEITRPGKYTIYAGLLYCTVPTPQEIIITKNDNIGLETPVIQATNNGILCSSGTVILTATGVSESVKWFHNDALYDGSHTNPLSVSGTQMAGEWFAVQQSASGCGSHASNKITLINRTSGSTLALPAVAINGIALSSNPAICKGGTLELKITNSYPAGTIFEWFINGASIHKGTELVIYTSVAPNATSMTLMVQASNNLGDCPNTVVSPQLNVVSTAPNPTTINNGAKIASICGTTAAVLQASNSTGASYEWFKDGVLIPAANTSTYLTNQTGSYTVRYKDVNGCWSQISTPITVNQTAAITLNWLTEPNSTENINTQESYTVSASPTPESYTWTSSNNSVATVTPLEDGKTVLVNFISTGSTFIKVVAQNTCGKVSLEKEVTVIPACTPITSVNITPKTTVIKRLDVNGAYKTGGDAQTVFTASATNGSPTTGYEWYVNNVKQLEVNATFTYPTPTPNAGTYNIYAAAINACTPTNTAKSATVTVNVLKDFTVDNSGNYYLNGKTCFDVKRLNDGGVCGSLNSRTDDFASTKTFTYTFNNSTTYTNLEFDLLDNNGLVVSTTTSGKTFSVTFRNDINTVASGKDKTNALKLTVIAKFKNSSAQDRQVELDVYIQDCSCGCPVKSGSGWLTFMCYNLGASPQVQQMTIEQQMATVSPTGANVTNSNVYGDLYQWGRRPDNHQLRNSPTVSGPLMSGNFDATTGQPSGSNVGKFVTVSNDWRYPDNNGLWSFPKTSNDPCPPGWRVPTAAEWSSIITSNTWTQNTTGTPGAKVSPDGGATYTLFLPAAGRRIGSSAANTQAGTDAYYWSVSQGNSVYSQYFYFERSNLGTMLVNNTNGSRGYGMSVRCVAE